MLLTIIGGSPEEKRRARKAVWNGALTDIEIEKMSGAELAAMASTEALFGGAEGYRLQNIFSGKRGISTGETEEESEAAPAVFGDEALTPDFFLAVASALANSSHTFILEEEKLLAKPKAALQRAGAEIVELKAAEKKEPFNVFALGNALGKRDRKNIWLLLMRAFEDGVAPENIAGILAWKARSMVGSARGAEEKKSWARTSRELVLMYHDSHRGAGDLALLLERFALKL